MPAFPIKRESPTGGLTRRAGGKHHLAMANRNNRPGLRARVAARKAGRESMTVASAPKTAARKWLGIAGVGMQVLAFLLLLAEILRLILSNFVGIEMGRLVLLLVLFFTGRAIQIILAFRRH